MRNALLAVAAVLMAVVAGWLIDDKLLGGDIARNTSVSGVDIGKLDHLMNVVGELGIVKSAVGKLLDRLRGDPEMRALVAELHRVHRGFERHLDDLQDGILDVSDPVFTLAYLFLGGAMPPPPFPTCDTDLDPGSFGCLSSAGCP